MGLKKGMTNNRAGRPKGTPNKVTTDLRQSVKAFLEKNWRDVQKEFNQLEPKDKLAFIDKLMAYALPKLQSVDMVADVSFAGVAEEQLDKLLMKILES